MPLLQARVLIPRPLRRLLSPHFKYRALRALEDFWPSLSFALSPARARNQKRALARCRTAADYLGFTKTYLGVGSVQHLPEIEAALQAVGALAPRRVCEIGTEHGGTTLLLARALPTVETLIGVDLHIKHAPQLRAFTRAGQSLHLVRGSSYAPKTVARVEALLKGEQLDVLFIDGDHSYDGVKADFLGYRHLVREGGLILFHDIVPDHKARYGQETGAWTGGVPLLWERLRALYPHQEFIRDAEQDGLGIGLLHYSPAIELPDELIESQDDADSYAQMVRQASC